MLEARRADGRMSPSGFDVNTIGYILLVVGIVGALLSMTFWSSWAGPGYFRCAVQSPVWHFAGSGERLDRRSSLRATPISQRTPTVYREPPQL
jgi:hypothetical protein